MNKTVRDLFEPIPFVTESDGVYWRLPDAADVCSPLGIDPDMPVETLKRALALGLPIVRLAAMPSCQTCARCGSQPGYFVGGRPCPDCCGGTGEETP